MRARSLVAAALSLGCASASRPSFRAPEFPEPWLRPSFTLRAADSTRFDFGVATRGRATLLLFGYTSCPDVCPVTVSRIAETVRRLGPDVRERLAVVFVATDERDTPTRLAAWLGRFDPRIIGLSGSAAELAQAAAAAFVPFVPGRPEHYVKVIGIGADDSARVLFEPTTTTADWVHDIALLVCYPSRPPCAPAANGGAP